MPDRQVRHFFVRVLRTLITQHASSSTRWSCPAASSWCRRPTVDDDRDGDRHIASMRPRRSPSGSAKSQNSHGGRPLAF